MTPIYVKSGDTFFTRSNSILGSLIRWGERDKGEEPSWANHAGVVVEDGWIGGRPIGSVPHWGDTVLYPDEAHGTMIAPDKDAIVVEALWKTRKGTWDGWKDGTEIRVFRPIPPYTPEELSRFEADANSYVGDTYGYWKLAGFLIKKITGIDVPSLFFIDTRPICSYLAAKVNDAARKIRSYYYGMNNHADLWPEFGMEPQAADPDEMCDFCEAHPEYWQEVK
jgi:hypothetical protein